MAETQFKKGNPARWMPIGSRRLIDGYVYIKLADVRYVPHTHNWYPEHVIDWEIANRRPLPPEHALRFRNGDRTDLRLDNLELISRRDCPAAASRPPGGDHPVTDPCPAFLVATIRAGQFVTTQAAPARKVRR
jgi:hypothetical protein